ncbi:MAG: hypothetical protein JW895_15155 [Thermoleophilaceae bacterium]|nr:hypothetical protein [Thermoleophilaceae bacterium]
MIWAAAMTALAAAAGGPATGERLVDTYSPVVMLRTEENPPCDNKEEQYRPTSVRIMLGNPKVRLRIPQPGRKARTVASAPTAADLLSLPPGAFLDLPGDALRPRCRYARDFAALRDAGRAPPLTYAHIAREPGRSGLAVQYFFFYYFNQFNDLHEGDWEGMQIAFEDADTPAQALEQGPTRMVLFQHRGGEQADWDDAKVEKRGTHPVVYPAAGSHATFYGPAVYVGHGSDGSGVGCDNTTPPLHAVRPRPVLLPDDPEPGDPAAWLLFDGHWGEPHGGISGDGPTGPMLKNQWYEPFTWMEAQRRTSPVLPATSIAGPDVTHVFCGAVAEVSEFMNLKTRSDAAGWAILALIVAALLVALRLTRWRPVAAGDLRHRRALGQLLAAAGALYARHIAPMVAIGLAALPLLVLLEAVDWLGRWVLFDEDPPGLGSGGARLPLSDPLITYARPLVFALVAATVVAYVSELDRTGQPRTMAAVRLMVTRCWRVLACHVLRSVIIGLLVLSVIGIPVAVRKYVDWQFIQQSILFEDESVPSALRRSTDVVRGRWWRTARVTGFFFLVSVVAGPALSVGLIFADLSLPVINLIGSILFAVIAPYVTLGRTLLFLDLQAHPAQVPGRPLAVEVREDPAAAA